MFERHGVSVEEANEALEDEYRLALIPDPASKSGKSIRTIGRAASTGRLVTVITLEDEGVIYGVNGWPSNDVDTRKYEDKDRGYEGH